jgi:hypothetical protein
MSPIKSSVLLARPAGAQLLNAARVGGRYAACLAMWPERIFNPEQNSGTGINHQKHLGSRSPEPGAPAHYFVSRFTFVSRFYLQLTTRLATAKVNVVPINAVFTTHKHLISIQTIMNHNRLSSTVGGRNVGGDNDTTFRHVSASCTPHVPPSPRRR